jgi:hypothetical protein
LTRYIIRNPEEAQMRRPALLLLCAMILTAPAAAQELRPLSAADRARVDSLLQAFDPNSYSFTYSYLDAQGEVQTARVGRAVGLAELRQSNTVRRAPPPALAGTNTTINVFRESMGLATNLNIFREFANTGSIPLFGDATLDDRARALNLLLQQYYTEAPRRINRPARAVQPVQRPVQAPRPH